MNRTSLPALTASTPNAIARCVLPTPGLPTSRTFSARSTNRRVASSSTFGLGTEGWNDQSKSARDLTYGKPDDLSLCLRIRCSLDLTSAEVISASADTNSMSPSETILM